MNQQTTIDKQFEGEAPEARACHEAPACAEGDPRAREELLQQFVLNTPAPVAMFDNDMRYLLTSRRWISDYQLREDELIGKHHYDIFPDLKESWKAAHRRCLGGAIERCDEDRWERADGTIAWIRWQIQPWRQADGTIGGLIMFSEVITRQKQADEQIRLLNAELERSVRDRTAELEAATREADQAQQALRESERRLRLIAENSTDAIFAWDMERRLIYVNPAVERLTGYTVAELSRRHFIDWVHPDDKGQLDSLREDLFAGKSYDDLEFRLITKGGAIKWCLSTCGPLYDESGRQVGVQGRDRDITERKLADLTLRESKEALDQSERKLRSLIQSINAIVWEADAQTFQFTFVSEQAEQILGYPVADWLNVPNFWADHIYSDDRQDAVAYCLESTRMAADHAFEYRMIAADGRVVWLHDLVAVEAEDGRPMMLRGVMFDITERKRLEGQLLQSQKMESIGRLAGGLAHDFNNLLTAISGYTSLAMTDLTPDSSIRGDLDEILRAAQRAAKLTRQLLAFARRNVVEPRVFDLNELVLDMNKLLRRLIGEDVELVTLPAPALGHVKADPGQIEQVLINLAVNARDAMPTGGKLTIATGEVVLEHSRTIALGARPGGYVRLRVSDTGAGMADEVKAHVFEPFFTTKTQGAGTGLGLAICYGIIAQAGGHIEFDSAPGRGTTFDIYLPQVADDTSWPARHDGGDAAPRGSETVLLVEDEPAVRTLGARVLRRHGYTVLEAANGVEALRVAHDHAGPPIDLLLTDIVMPQMGGEALAEQFRAAYPSARVLFTSGYADSASFRGSVLDQGVPFLEKPFSPSALVHKLREVLDS